MRKNTLILIGLTVLMILSLGGFTLGLAKTDSSSDLDSPKSFHHIEDRMEEYGDDFEDEFEHEFDQDKEDDDHQMKGHHKSNQNLNSNSSSSITGKNFGI